MRERDAHLVQEQTERKRQNAKDSAAAAREALAGQVAANAHVVRAIKGEKAIMAMQLQVLEV
jgi:hypothetical protein